MSQVMIVCQNTGNYYCVDVDGKRIPEGDAQFIAYSDIDVLVNRLAGGHIELPDGYIALVLELNGKHPEDYFEFTKMVHLVPHSTPAFGYNLEPELVEFVTREEREGSWAELDPSALLGRLAVVDYEAQKVLWLDNPLANDWATTSYHRASKVVGGSTGHSIMNLARAQIESESPQHVVLIPVVVKLR